MNVSCCPACFSSDWILPAVSCLSEPLSFHWIGYASLLWKPLKVTMRTEVRDLKQYMYSYNYKKLGANDCKLN